MTSPDYLAKVVFCPTVTNPSPKGYGELTLDLRAWGNLKPNTWYTLIVRAEGSELLQHTITNGELDEGTPVEREE